MWLIPFSVSNTICATFLGYTAFLADTGAGATIALTVSAVNAIAALLTGYAALKTIKRQAKDEAIVEVVRELEDE